MAIENTPLAGERAVIRPMLLEPRSCDIVVDNFSGFETSEDFCSDGTEATRSPTTVVE